MPARTDCPRCGVDHMRGSPECPGSRVGKEVASKYRLGRLIGAGGMGAVYEAEHLKLGTRVALKMLHPKFSENAEVVARFYEEARQAAALDHPGIVEVDRVQIVHATGFAGSRGVRHSVRDAEGWTTEWVGDGSDPSLAVDSEDALHAVYWTGDLRYGRKAGGEWTLETVHAGATAWGTSIDLDREGFAHVSYSAGESLRHATNASGEWVLELVVERTAEETSLVLDEADVVHIAYDSGSSRTARAYYATNASGEWSTVQVDGDGMRPAIAVDSEGRVHVAYRYFVPGEMFVRPDEGGARVANLDDVDGNCNGFPW